MDISAVLLHKILKEKDIDVYSKIKLQFLHPAYSTLFSIIGNYYNKYNDLPGFEDLNISVRESSAYKVLEGIKSLEVPDVETEVVLNALIDEFTQSETIKLLEPFITKLPLYDSTEIRDNLASIALKVEENSTTSEKLFNMNDLIVFQNDLNLKNERTFLGLNPEFDAAIGGLARGEVLLIGGKVGTGKSLVSSNIFVNQYLAGNSCILFSIEMPASQVHARHISMLSDVPLKNIVHNSLDKPQVDKIAKTLVDMYCDSNEVWQDYLQHGDRYTLESSLVHNCTLKSDNQMVIVDDRDLTINAIDLHIAKGRAKFKDKLAVVVVDYVNQIAVDNGLNQLDWQPQIELSKRLKNLARKHDVAIVSPYQIDDGGKTRFAKGILDSADLAITLEREGGIVKFKSVKTRGSASFNFNCPINWDTLKIYNNGIAPSKLQESTEDIPYGDTDG